MEGSDFKNVDGIEEIVWNEEKFTKPPKEAKLNKNAGKLLPIFKHKNEIMDRINKQTVTVVQGETGSGKSSQVPQYIIEQRFFIFLLFFLFYSFLFSLYSFHFFPFSC